MIPFKQKNICLGILLILILFSCQEKTLGLGDVKIDNPSGTYQISGRIMDLDGEALANCRIFLQGSAVYSGLSDAQGDYEFNNLPQGHFQLRADFQNHYCYPELMTNQVQLEDSNAIINFRALFLQSEMPFIPICDIQGMAHQSPLLGERVSNVIGCITALKYGVGENSRHLELFIQDPNQDNEPASSEAVKVFTTNAFEAERGDLILLKSAVVEEDITNPFDYYSYWDGGLSRTQLRCTASDIQVLSKGNPLPPPVLLGQKGRPIPSEIICDDAFQGNLNHPRTLFDPQFDAVDYFESLEHIYVQLDNPVFVAPKNAYSDAYVVSADRLTDLPLSPRGGLVLKDYHEHYPFIIKLTAYYNSPKKCSIGSRVEGSVYGFIDYAFNSFGLFMTEEMPDPQDTNIEKETTELQPEEKKLTIASFNIENFTIDGYEDESGNRKEKKFEGVAETIALNLRCPDILGLIEVQDDSGANEDGVISCDKTMDKLIELVQEIGPQPLDYKYVYINPEYGKDGGEPGGNIRVVVMYNALRVSFSGGLKGPSDESTRPLKIAGQVKLSYNPGRIYPEHSSFEYSRKPLIAEFLFQGQQVFVIANHFNSKRGDAPIMGFSQPPVFLSEVNRHKQASIVNRFIKEMLSLSHNLNIVVLGDLNDYYFSETLDILKGQELINLVETLPADQRYSYIHDGICQSLDYILISYAMARLSPEIDIVHCFSDMAHSDSQIFSDHDPVIARFNFE